MTAYINELRKELQSIHVAATAVTLSQRVTNWHRGLPEASRARAFSMAEIESGLGAQGRYLGPELLALGWVRKRRWAKTGQYYRFWLPPAGKPSLDPGGGCSA